MTSSPKHSDGVDAAPRRTYHARSAEDLLNALPAALGFVPAESLIGACASGPRRRLGFMVRVDLPDDRRDAAAVAEHVAGHLLEHVTDGVILIGLSADPERAEDMVHEVAERLPAARVRLRLWATADRYWIAEPGFDPAGEPYALSPNHPARVEAVLAGQVIADRRADLIEEIEPVTGPRRAWLDAAVTRLTADLFGRRRPGWEADHAAQVVRLIVAGPRDDGETIRLGLLVSRAPGRDVAWSLTASGRAREMYALWCATARLVGGSAAAPALGLAGCAAWRSGDGVRAMNAVERALALDPEDVTAELLRRAVSAGIDPRRLDDALRR